MYQALQSREKPLQLVLGLGKTGLSCIRHLVLRGERVAVMDNRSSPPELSTVKQAFPDLPIFLGPFDPDRCAQASRIIISPGLSTQDPALAAAIDSGIPVIGDIELFTLEQNAPVVAITGSNGKSTVTSLLGHMATTAGLQVRVGGNLGLPALDLLTTPPPDAYLLELSSFQLETTYSLSSLASTILNLSEDHMDRYSSLLNYKNAKQRIYRGTDTAVINREDTHTIPDWPVLNIRSFGLDRPDPKEFGLLSKDGQTYLAYGRERLLDVRELRIVGRHQYANALAALALGKVLNLPLESMLNALKTFQGLPHRCQWIGSQNGVQWYNDSKATNVGAACASISGLGEVTTGRLIVIGGGIGKEADFSPLRSVLSQYARSLILLGRDAHRMAEALTGAVPIEHVADLAKAVSVASTAAKPGDIIVLAPACASYDMFDHFEHRGEMFVQAVQQYLNINDVPT